MSAIASWKTRENCVDCGFPCRRDGCRHYPAGVQLKCDRCGDEWAENPGSIEAEGAEHYCDICRKELGNPEGETATSELTEAQKQALEDVRQMFEKVEKGFQRMWHSQGVDHRETWRLIHGGEGYHDGTINVTLTEAGLPPVEFSTGDPSTLLTDEDVYLRTNEDYGPNHTDEEFEAVYSDVLSEAQHEFRQICEDIRQHLDTIEG